MGSSVWVRKIIMSTEIMPSATGSSIGASLSEISVKATEYSILCDP